MAYVNHELHAQYYPVESAAYSSPPQQLASFAFSTAVSYHPTSLETSHAQSVHDTSLQTVFYPQELYPQDVPPLLEYPDSERSELLPKAEPESNPTELDESLGTVQSSATKPDNNPETAVGVKRQEAHNVDYYTPPLSESPRELSGEEVDPDAKRLYALQCRRRNGHPHVACYHCKHRKMKCDSKVYDRDGRPWCQPCIDRRGPCYWPPQYHQYIMEAHANAMARGEVLTNNMDDFDPGKCFERTSWSWRRNLQTGRNEFDDKDEPETRRRKRRSRLYNWWDIFSVPETIGEENSEDAAT
ncbi:hypothetical protein DACRYDRAFT_110227 [Dacryopinax primogenitus]|uniref:Zn(2)-C6 fungal-type domain-containing protein n=1 Tax=Dacryopinax primogenitus (strain DJM 731) TaxID=1858805 RepID=M5FQ03_DACPD|nr:uncharacterized protein DACRYDRAFT_110227 [Dacryopinax primogenitus]EJT98890.1 hypothetical protein DACRYDRAFT_110227 [Dacryopinax primogenitus]